jgi:hypothetical protein
MDFGKLCQEFGLVGILIGGILTMFFFIIKWILQQFQKELDGNRSERKEYLCILDTMKDEIENHNKRASEFQTMVSAEHKEMIIILGRINGYKHD